VWFVDILHGRDLVHKLTINLMMHRVSGSRCISVPYVRVRAARCPMGSWAYQCSILTASGDGKGGM
jgi:DNA-binding helix-hairpin-helix protein with protein kinase domain